MNLIPIHTMDRILADNKYIIPMDNPQLPLAVRDGVVIVREQNENLTLELNQYVVREIYTIWANESLTNRRRRIYALLGTREPGVVEEWLESLTPVQIKEPSTYNPIWEYIVRIGNYKEQYDEATLTLDYLVYKDILEYEVDGRYSLSTKWVRNIFQKYSMISYYTARANLRSEDMTLVSRMMAQFGFDNNPDMERYERMRGNSYPTFFTG